MKSVPGASTSLNYAGTPYYGAAMQNQNTTYTLELTNIGLAATTYALTTTLPGSVAVEQAILNPGETYAVNYPLSIADIGLYDLSSIVEVVGQETIAASAEAKLNVVDRFVQLTSVQPDPDFVETGTSTSTSTSTIFIEVANIANLAQDATARTTINAPDGTLAYYSDSPVTVLVGAPRNYQLETVDTSGWAAGVYTVTVALLDASETLIPDGSGYGYLGVGQLLGASHAISTEIVPPGDITITTQITTELLVPGIVPQNVNVVDWRVSLSQSIPVTQSPDLPVTFSPQVVDSIDAIHRTQDISPTVIYSGSWSTTNNIYATHTSDGSYKSSNTPGNSATFEFTGTWIHIGMGRDRNGGQAEILVDGISQGTVDLYRPHSLCYISECLANFAFAGLSDASHTLEINVSDTSHPNSAGTLVKLDYIDTWDGTEYPDGIYQQDDARVWGRIGEWSTFAEPAASGGSFMKAADTLSVWFPFTGDSVSFIALARDNSHSVRVSVDGIWQGNLKIYSNEPISKTYSFSGFGEGPHILQVSGYRGEPSIDAFVTPALGPDYDPPSFTGFVRFEEDHPALRYNGYDFLHRPLSWSISNEPQPSEYAYMSSSTISDTITLTFDGSWLNIGLRTRNRGGLADVSIDGVSYGTINSYDPAFDVTSYQYDLIEGTHTLTITVLDQSDPVNLYNDFYLDFIEIWDGSPVTDNFQNARKSEESGRVYVSSSTIDATHENAIQGDWVSPGLSNSNANVWYSFVGNSFTFYGLTKSSGGSAEVYVDGQLVETVSFDYPFTEQPVAFHYNGFDFGPHAVRVHNVSSMRVDGFEANPNSLASYQPILEWHESDRTAGGSVWGGLHVPAAVGDVMGDGKTEIVVASSNIDNSGELFLLNGDGSDSGDGDPILWSVPYNIFNGFEDVGSARDCRIGRPTGCRNHSSHS